MFIRALLCALFLSYSVTAAAQAGPAQPVIIQTNVVLAEIGFGTFAATAPLCTTGTSRALREVRNPSLLHGHGFTVWWEYTCDDNSGTFLLEYHPQSGSNYAGGTRNPEFDVAGPWTVFAGGTGRYANMTGHGDVGVLLDFNVEPWTAQESFVGFVQFH